MALLTGAVSISVLGLGIHGAEAALTANQERQEMKKLLAIIVGLVTGGISIVSSIESANALFYACGGHWCHVN